jgi:hypothetical protein
LELGGKSENDEFRKKAPKETHHFSGSVLWQLNIDFLFFEDFTCYSLPAAVTKSRGLRIESESACYQRELYLLAIRCKPLLNILQIVLY